MPNQSQFFSRRSVLTYAGVMILLFGIGIGVFFLGKFYAADILNEVIKRETNGFYRLNFESLDLDLLENRINVKELKLEVDSTKDFSSLGISNIYEIQLEELIIDLESIYALYFDKELVIKSVRVVDPGIDMVSLKTAEKTKFSFEAGNMYQAISDYLKVLKIDYFRIQDGELQYNGDRFALGEIDFIVRNLLMDTVSRENQVFYSEQIELEIRNQIFHLPDSIHEVTFDRFVLSTSDSVLSFENFRVRPMPSSGVTFKGLNDINVYDIHVPKLSLKGIDYVAAYQNNHLLIDELILDEPTVFVDDETHARSTKRDRDNSLLALIFQVFGALDVNKLSIQNAHVDLKIDGKDKYQRFKVEESNIIFHGIHLDTSNFRFDHRFQYFEDIELDIHNYTYLLPDSVHTLFFELLRVNSFDSELRLEGAKVSHERAGNEAKVLVDARIPSFKLSSVDFQRAIVDKILIAGTMEVKSGLLQVRNTGENTKKGAFTIKDIYKSLAPFFREIMIDNLSLTDIAVTLPRGVDVDRIDLTVKDVHVSKASNDFQRLFRDSQLLISGFSFDRDSIVVVGDQMSASNRMSSFRFLDWSVSIDKANQKVAGSFDTLQISEVNIDSTIAGNYMTFTKALLINPDFDLTLNSAEQGGNLDLGIEKELIIQRGKVAGIIDSVDFSIESLDADIFIGDSTAFRSAGIQNINVRSMPLNHSLAMSEWQFDTLDGKMEFDDLVIRPIDESDTSKLIVQANIPFIRLTDFEQSHFFDENHLFADLIHISRPEINILGLVNVGSKADSLEGKSPFTMAVKTLRIDTAGISLHSFGNEEIESFTIGSLNALLHNLDYPQDQPFESNFFYSDSVDLAIYNLSPTLVSGDSSHLGSIRYATSSQDIVAQSLYYGAADEQLVLQVPLLELKQVDIKKLFNDGVIEIDTAKVSGVSGHNQRVAAKDQSKPFTQKVSVDHVAVENINWHYGDTLNQKDYYLVNGNLQLDQFHSEDTLKLTDLPDRIDRLHFAGGPFTLPLEDGYSLTLDSYHFSYPERIISLEGMKLKSDYSPVAYSSLLSQQSDWFDVEVKEASIEKFDLRSLLYNEKYAAEKISLLGVDALIYRDKSIPFPVDQTRPLPQETIRSIQHPFQIDTIHILGTIRYQEKPDNYDTHGEISFNQIDGRLINVGNVSIDQHEMMLLNATGKLMGTGAFNVSGAFNLKREDEPFSLSGSVTDFSLDSMNRMLGPVANVNIKSGFAKDLYFNFNANDTLARGEMRFRYDDLKVQILNVKTHDTHGFGQGIKTFFANTFVVKTKNPSYFFFLRKGTIFQRRDTSRAIFNYWGKSLLSGAVSSIGVHKSDKEEKKFERKTD